MRQLEIWLGKNDLIVNIDKTCAISFHPHQNNHPSRPRITFKNNEIAYSSELKFLGLFITETLAWHAQIHSLCASLSKSDQITEKCYEYPDDLEHLLCLFPVKIKVRNHVLGWRWKIYKDIPATKKGHSINHCHT